MPPGNELNNREWATLVWIGVGLIWLLWRKETRESSVSLLRTAANPVLVVPAIVMWAWTAIVVFVAYRLHLWTNDLIKDTVIWSIGPALGLYFSANDVGKDPHFFRRAALRTIRYSVLIEFYVNLRVFSLFVELVLLPGVTLLALLVWFAGTDEKYRPTKCVLDVLVGLVGLAIVIYVTASLIGSWRQEDPWHDLRELALPIWLTIGVLPFVLAFSLFSGYQAAFWRIDWHTNDRRVRRLAKFALLLELNVSAHPIAKFGGGWLTQIAGARSFDEARGVVRRYREANSSAVAERIEPETDSL